MPETKELSDSYLRKENAILSIQEIYNTPEYAEAFVEIEGPNPILYANISEASNLQLGFLQSNEYYNHVIASENGLTFVNSSSILNSLDILAIDEYTKEVPDIQVQLEENNKQDKISSRYHIHYPKKAELISFPHGLVGLRENDRIYNSFREYTLNHLLSEQARINREMQYRLEQNTVNMCRIILENRESIRVRDLPNKKIGVYKRIPGVYLVISDLGLSQCFVQSGKPSPPSRELLLLEKYLHKCFTNNWRDLLLEDSIHHEIREGTVQDIIDIVHKHDGLEKVLERGIIQNY